MGTWNFQICLCLITGLAYITNIKENVAILLTRKGKIIGGKFKFGKSLHELVQIKQWQQKKP